MIRSLNNSHGTNAHGSMGEVGHDRSALAKLGCDKSNIRFGAMPRGFTLIELLVVIAIIVVVISIIVPAVGGARRVARSTSSKALMSQVSTSIQTFRNDNDGRMPGYYTPAELGSAANTALGLTAMENAMLELAAPNAIEKGDNQTAIDLGGNVVNVDFNLIGVGAGVYFTPTADNFVAQVDGQQVGAIDQGLPDLVDAFGHPILLWAEDPAAPRTPSDLADFAAVESNNRSRFYWNTNAAFLSTTQLGKSGRDQTTLSLIGSGASDLPEAMAAVLGDPGSPTPVDYTAATVLPGSPRGSYVIQSAGADGVYLGNRDKGARVLPGGELRYQYNFFDGTGRITGASGQLTTIDVLSEFDDTFVSGK